MDLPERLISNNQDFFEEQAIPLRIPAPPSQFDQSLIHNDAFPFNIEESLDYFQNHNRLPQPFMPNFDQCQSLRDNHDVDDTNPLDDLLQEYQKIEQPQSQQERLNIQVDFSEIEQIRNDEQQPGEEYLVQQQIINFLVEFSNLSGQQLRRSFKKSFPGYAKCTVVETLMQKFSKLKKTKEELIKYCMRKAFKFILELPKNKHLLSSEKTQKMSFSKCKNRYLKKISDQKSMNNKFLQQIFSDIDFSNDYRVFLDHFQTIMEDDNQKKVNYLAWLLTNEKDGKKKSIEMVKRLPWTNSILQRVKKISIQLLKFSPEG